MTSSSEVTTTAGAAPEVFHHALAHAGARAATVRTSVPVRVIERAPPPPPLPRIDTVPLARALDSGFKAVRAQVETALGEIERECVLLALAAAESLTRAKCERGELALDEPLRALLDSRRRDLETMPATLRANPEDADALAPQLDQIKPAGARIELVRDPAVPRGQLALELQAARVVWSLGQDLIALRAKVLGEGAR
ncbi:MAG: hypothetical protein EXS13_07110 [Planctomycetes bacterium]|nr:hypothetical protein [Planctomycetota bacterium]